MSKTPQGTADRYLLLAVYYAIYLLCFTSWIIYRDYYQRKFQYSAVDIIYLLMMSLPLFFPILIWFAKERIHFFRSKSNVFVTLSVVATWYALFSGFYYNTQEHLFDPFVQMPHPLVDKQDIEQSKKSFRILTLGGSTTRGFRLPLDKNYPNVLRSILRETFPSTMIDVFNAGVEWYTSKHSLINYVTYYQDWSPDVTIVMHGVNDLFRSCAPTEFAVGPYQEGWSHFYGPAVRGAKPLTFEQFIIKPMLHPWVSRFATRAIDYPMEFYVSRDAFEGNLYKLIKIIKERGSIPVFVTEPSLYKEKMSAEEIRTLWMGQVLCNTKRNFIFTDYPSFLSLYHAMKTFNEKVKKVTASESAHLIDAEAFMSKDLNNFLDDVHHTELGADRLAKIVAAELTNRRLIKERNASPRLK